MYVRGVRLQDYSHLEWQKLNIEQYSTLVEVWHRSAMTV